MGFFSDINQDDLNTNEVIESKPIVMKQEEENIEEEIIEVEENHSYIQNKMKKEIFEENDSFSDTDLVLDDIEDFGEKTSKVDDHYEYEEDSDILSSLDEEESITNVEETPSIDEDPFVEENSKTLQSYMEPIVKTKETYPINIDESDIETTRIGKNSTFVGDIISEGSIIISGKIEGSVTAKKSINILNDACVLGSVTCGGRLNASGKITGPVQCSGLNLNNGRIDGDIQSNGNVIIEKRGKVVGCINADSLTLMGALKGDVSVKGKLIVDDKAILKGSVRAADISIATTARMQGIIERICSDGQDIDESIFD